MIQHRPVPDSASRPAVPGRPSPVRVAVLGAGPVGLDVALAARARGFRVRVFEAGRAPAANVRSWGHVRLFTPWRMNLSGRMRDALAEVGRTLDADPEDSPMGREYVAQVLDPIWTRPDLREALRLGVRVVAVGREGALKHEEIGAPERGRRPFRLLLSDGSGREWVEHADLVFDCTGTWGNPNTVGDGGIPAPGERALAEKLDRRIPDPGSEAEEWADCTILLVGAGHSAQTAARSLADLAGRRRGTRVIWAVRAREPDWSAVPDDPLPERRALTRAAEEIAAGASPAVETRRGAVVEELAERGGRFRVRFRQEAEGRGGDAVDVDRVLALTGGVGDADLYRQLQVHECYATSGPMKLSAALLGTGSADCLAQESHGADTLRNPEPNFFILGDKSYGRHSTFLLRTGWSQVDEVFGSIPE